ncbi:cytochrome d ubiquinol oxidase subunit II [Bradyrhizobium septentrionale]|uniref:cytochrome d ubiquinol oxidase subunit II n=1 Tax=Bradyrhizobium septentrionale TaxID=1404411 RepID=UPI003BAFFAE3
MILFWASLLAATTLLYVLLDGFDLGVGILFAFADEPNRRKMLGAISPVWDGNETWLVITGTVLFGAFPAAYAALLSAFYLPLVLMLCALILRGVAFEFRYKSLGFRWFWDLGFAGGSFVATFIQGMTVGALVEGLPMKDGHYIGGTLGWFSPFAALCGFGLVLGYTLLGASWLVRKCEGEIRARLPVAACDDRCRPCFSGHGRCAGAHHASPFDEPLARASVSPDLPSDRSDIFGLLAEERTAAQRLGAVRILHADLPRSLRHLGLLVLAIHDSVRAHGRASSVTSGKSELHLLGGRSLRHAAHAHIHVRGLQALSRKSGGCGLRIKRQLGPLRFNQHRRSQNDGHAFHVSLRATHGSTLQSI